MRSGPCPAKHAALHVGVMGPVAVITCKVAVCVRPWSGEMVFLEGAVLRWVVVVEVANGVDHRVLTANNVTVGRTHDGPCWWRWRWRRGCALWRRIGDARVARWSMPPPTHHSTDRVVRLCPGKDGCCNVSGTECPRRHSIPLESPSRHAVSASSLSTPTPIITHAILLF
jgi:hypothetical protein